VSKATLIQNGLVYANGRCEALDVLIENGRVARMARGIELPGAETVDLHGRVLSPGFVDIHVHLREPGFAGKETIRTGTQAAAAGGFTTICAMPNLNPVPDSLVNLGVELDIIRRDGCVEVLPYGSITVGEKGETLSDIEAMAPHVMGYTDDGKGVQRDELMEAAMVRIAATGRILAAHCEDERLVASGGCVHEGVAARRFGVIGISSESEWKQIERDLALVRRTGAMYHVCHVSAKESVALIRAGKAEGLSVTCECTPHQFLLCDEDITHSDGCFKMNPPLRGAEDRAALVEGLLDGTIDCIATDHAPHRAEEKAGGLQSSVFGVVGLETAFAVCYTALVVPGLCSLPFLLDKLTTGPARILGRDQTLREGSPANLVALDTEATWTVAPENFFSMGRNTPFTGRVLTGQVLCTWYQGEKIFDKGAIL